jgi:23S rRNA pseudouridine2605 synthase
MLQNLKRGSYRHLTKDEINHLQQIAKAGLLKERTPRKE